MSLGTTEHPIAAGLLGELNHLLSGHGRRELGDTRQHQITAEKGVGMAETGEGKECNVWHGPMHSWFSA